MCCCRGRGTIPLTVRSADGEVVNGPNNAPIYSHWLTDRRSTPGRIRHAAVFFSCCLQTLRNNQLNKPRGIEVKGRIAGLPPPPEGFTSPSCSESLMSRMCGNDEPPSSVERVHRNSSHHNCFLISTPFNRGKHKDRIIMMWWDLRIRRRWRQRGRQPGDISLCRTCLSGHSSRVYLDVVPSARRHVFVR